MTSKPFVFHEAAAAKYEAALDWCLERSPSAAVNFANEVSLAREHLCRAAPMADGKSWDSQILPRAISVYRFLPRSSFRDSSRRDSTWSPQAKLLA